MSDDCACEGCDAIGHRRRGHLVPEGWLFIETMDEDSDGDIIVTAACGEACALSLWRRGPGVLTVESAQSKDKTAPSAFVGGYTDGSDRVEAERERIAAWHEAGEPIPDAFKGGYADYIRAGLPGWEL